MRALDKREPMTSPDRQSSDPRAHEHAHLLLEITNMLVSTLDLGELLRRISECLKRVVPHDFAALGLWDEASGQLRVHSVDIDPNSQFLDRGFAVSLTGTPGGLAFSTRQMVRRDRLDIEEFNAPEMHRFLDTGLRSACIAPLVVHDRAIGVVSLASFRESTFTAEHEALLEAVAGQIAIAIDNALAYREIAGLKNDLARDRDRTQLLLDVTNALVSTLDLDELLRRVSACLRKVVPHDFAEMALFDAPTGRLRVHAFDVDNREARERFESGLREIARQLPGSARPLTDHKAGAPRDAATRVAGVDFTVSVEGTPAGVAFSTGRRVLIDEFRLEDFPAPECRLAVEAGIQSGCAVPLVVRDKVLGVVSVASFRRAAFTPDDAEILEAITSQVAIAVENAISYHEIAELKNTLAREKLYLEEEIRSVHNFAEIVGQSPALRRVLVQIETVAPTDSVVLVTGETGTGKELVARAIHDLSSRRERALVKLNCAAIPTGLLESELFGHEKGAFTGAIAQRIGRFELAHKGTLLLDEVGDIPLELQPKLLRVLQEHEFERLGSSRTIRVDTRLIAATNADLETMVSEKQFRGDLYYRLNVFPVEIPPLRARTEDIPLLAAYFVQKHGRRMRKEIRSIPREAVEVMSDYAWPGNVRELENFVERAVILTRGEELQAPLTELRRSAPAAIATGASQPADPERPLTMDEAERAHIQEVLRRTNGVVGGKGGAAEILDLPISTLRGRMKKLGIL